MGAQYGEGDNEPEGCNVNPFHIGCLPLIFVYHLSPTV